ncbi:MAG: hypothetical protein M0P00_03365 [Bacteroidaceae bacterium]|nr:hypothetical protein [Bacteroidaceae bacterium]
MFKFYTKINGTIQGPYSIKELEDLNLKNDTSIREESILDWKTKDHYDFEDLKAHNSLTEQHSGKNLYIDNDGNVKRKEIPINPIDQQVNTETATRKNNRWKITLFLILIVVIIAIAVYMVAYFNK